MIKYFAIPYSHTESKTCFNRELFTHVFSNRTTLKTVLIKPDNAKHMYITFGVSGIGLVLSCENLVLNYYVVLFLGI